VHAEERQRRVGDGVDQSAHQIASPRDERGVVAAERDDPRPVVVTGRRGEPVGLQPAARDDAGRIHRAAGGLEHGAGPRPPDRLDPPTQQQLDAR
jgi:hypothetical protein